jgi:hypothetical protein
MAAFQYQYSDLVMMIFKQIIVLALIIIAFSFGLDTSRNSILPPDLLPKISVPT